MGERYKSTPFWFGHPSVRNRHPSATFTDFLVNMSDVDLDEAVNAANAVGTSLEDPNKRYPHAFSANNVAHIEKATTLQASPQAKSGQWPLLVSTSMGYILTTPSVR